MKRLSRSRVSVRQLSVIAGFILLAAPGCGAATDDEMGAGVDVGVSEDVEISQEALVGATWQTLTLQPGWSNYWSSGVNPPAVALLPNGTVLFRGALKASSSAGLIAFYLPENFRPAGAHAGAMALRTVLSTGHGGTLTYRLNDYAMTVTEDGISPIGPGPKARALTSLDGVMFDKYIDGAGVTTLEPATDWKAEYPFRQADDKHGAFVQNVGGFVRFAGMLRRLDEDSTDGFLFSLPNQYCPQQPVYVPADLGANSSLQSWGQLSIYAPPSTGSPCSVYVGPNPYAANTFTSLENVAYALNSGNTAINLPLAPGWQAYSSRPVKVTKVDGVVRFEGAIKGGTTAKIATLPTGYRPATTVFIKAAAYGPFPARIYVDTQGNVGFDKAPINIGSLFLSLDGVAFGM